jgi:hypothetical protein
MMDIDLFSLPDPEEIPNDRSPDLLPEFTDYQDEGCKLATSCLKCPFPHCVDDRSRGRKKWPRELRDKEIVRLRLEEKKTDREIAAFFNVTPRTVYNALARYRRKLLP